MMQIVHYEKTVELYTASFMVSGKLNIIGELNTFLNDSTSIAFQIRNATLQSLIPHSAVNEIKAKETFVNKDQIQLALVGDITRDDAKVLPKRLPMICFTDTYVVKGTFRGGKETRPQDFFDYGGPFYAVTDFDVYTLKPLKVDVRGQGEVIFLNRNFISTFTPGEFM